MKGIMDLLARAKLVELNDEERASAAAAAPEVSAAPAPEPPAAPVAELAPAQCQVSEGQDLDGIYAAAGIPTMPFPAEKLLRLLDGLRTMDATTRKAAVLAMDAADDNWQVGDCVVDAQRKIAALEAYKQHLAAQVDGSERHTQSQIGDINTALANASTSIRTQISELEQLLQREIAKAAQATTQLEAELRAAREAAARESRRVDGEIEKLREIPTQFAAPGGAA